MNFTTKQREIIARKLGYDGPMQGFDEFLQSSPALMMKYNAVSDKYAQKMARGGVVKMSEGGDVVRMADGGYNQGVYDWVAAHIDNPRLVYDEMIRLGATPATLATALNVPEAQVLDYFRNAGITVISQPPPPAPAPPAPAPSPTEAPSPAPTPAPTPAPAPASGTVTGGGDVTFTDIGGKPQAGAPIQITAQQLSSSPDQVLTYREAPAATTVAGAPAAQAETVEAPQPLQAQTIDQTSKAADAIQQEVDKLVAARGTVSENALIKEAATKEPTSTAVAGRQAAQLETIRQVAPTAERQLQEGEMISGSAVDQQRMEQLIEQTKAEAAQGVVTEDMTVQGQLARLTANFDAKNPPAWASGALRAVTAVMASRGIGASSMAGQALIQAAIENALPIATADAQTYQQVALQNLSNKQQMAYLAAQQRAQFLGQEFDQNFQTRVLNAAKISEIANVNFTAKQQIAIENARLAQTVDLANLSNRQAMVLAETAQIASLETQNLSNQQQILVENAKTFLQMDLKNLDNEQQIMMFKAQQIANAILSDTAAENATKQFNATSVNQTNQFMASLSAQVSQFNAAQRNAVSQFNIDQANSIAKFNAEAQNARDLFNANQRLVIDQSNAQWRREISTANTAATNAANYLNAQNLQAMTLAEYNNETQLYRDQIEMLWSSGEKAEDRATQLMVAQINASAGLNEAEARAKFDLMKEGIGALVSIFENK